MPTWPIESIRELLAPTLEHMGFEIYALQQAGSQGNTLRVAIDKASGFISIEDCERVTKVIGPLLDQADLIAERYTLEVSSPGAERPLRNRAEYDRFLGKKVNVRYRSGPAEMVVEGALTSVSDTGIGVRTRSLEVVQIDWDDVIASRLSVSL